MLIGIGEKSKAHNDMAKELIGIRGCKDKYQLIGEKKQHSYSISIYIAVLPCTCNRVMSCPFFFFFWLHLYCIFTRAVKDKNRGKPRAVVNQCLEDGLFTWKQFFFFSQ